MVSNVYYSWDYASPTGGPTGYYVAEVDRTVTAEVIYSLLRWPDPPAEEPPRRPNLFWPPDPLPCDKSENSHIRHKPDIPAQPVRVHKSPRPGLGLRNYRKAA